MRPPSMRFLLKYLIALILAATAIAFGIWTFHPSGQSTVRSRPRPEDPKSESVKETVLLRAETHPANSGSVVRLQWNASAKPIRGSPYGILYIYDGGVPSKLLLDRRVLDSGSTEYTPATGEVTFHLLLAGGPPEGESLIVLLRAREKMPGVVDSAAARKSTSASDNTSSHVPVTLNQTQHVDQ